MVQDAEINKEADKKFHELVEVRNKADNLVHAASKSVRDLGDQATAEEKQSIEKLSAELKELIKGEDKQAIEAKTNELSDIAGKLAERVYAKQQAGSAEQSAGDASSGQQQPQGDDVVDAEFEEVKDNKGSQQGSGAEDQK